MVLSSSADGGGPAPERLEHQLQLIVASRVGEDQIAWTIFSVFWAASVLLVGVLFQGPSFPPDPALGFTVSLVGALMSIAWALTQQRALVHLERHEELIKSIETELSRDGHLRVEHQLSMQQPPSGWRARTIMRVSCWAAVCAWLLSVIVFAGVWR